MKEMQKIKALLDLELYYSGSINKSDYIVCISMVAFQNIKMNLSIPENKEEANLLGVEFRVIDCRDPYYITVIHKDLIHSLFREVQCQIHKTLDTVAYRTSR